jgi:competence protein ComEC
LGALLAERGLILRRWSDPLQGLSLAALVVLALTPAALFDVSFQLSFAATAGILLAVGWARPRLQRALRRLRPEGTLPSLPRRFALWLLEKGAYLVLISAAAQLAVAPVIAYHFGRLFGGALLANLLVVPMVTVALWLGVLFLAVGILLPPAAALLGAIEGLWLSGLAGVVGFFAKLPWAYVRVDAGTWATAGVFPLLLFPLLLDPGPRSAAGYFAWAISRISAANASPSFVKRSMARLATLRGRSERRR